MSGHRNPEFVGEARTRFLDYYRAKGVFCRAALHAGFNETTVRDHMKGDPEFAAQVKEAYQDYKDHLEEMAQARAFDGIESDLFNAKGEPIGTKRVFSDRLAELMLKRHIPEYRDKGTLDVNHQGGVLVVPGTTQDADAWRESFKQKDEV